MTGSRDESTTRRGVIKYAGLTGLGVPATAGLATQLYRNHAGLTVTEGAAGILLTWQRDPTTTMTIDWHTTPDQDATSALEYAPASTDDWEAIAGDSWPFPHSTRTVHRVELTDLEPATAYDFRLPALGERYSFRTMPATVSKTEPVTFATGGDTMHSWKFLASMNEVITDYDVEFIQWGGDLAYADGLPQNVVEWYDWFAVNKHTLETDEGRLIPVVPSIGNHEVRGQYYYEDPDYEQTDAHRRSMAPYVYDLLAFPGQPGYDVLDFGDYLSLLALDSNHTNPIRGAQTEWLEARLAERTEVDHVIPSYHVPAYPANRDPTGRDEWTVRETWSPLFEQYGVDIALEHHDHVYKRTVPIKRGQPDPDGVVYAGDGAWGVDTRAGENRHQWYIDEYALERHGKIARLTGSALTLEVLGESGETIDSFGV